MKKIKIIFKIVGIVMLVPGSRAFISLSSFFGTPLPDIPSNMGSQLMYIHRWYFAFR